MIEVLTIQMYKCIHFYFWDGLGGSHATRVKVNSEQTSLESYAEDGE